MSIHDSSDDADTEARNCFSAAIDPISLPGSLVRWWMSRFGSSAAGAARPETHHPPPAPPSLSSRIFRGLRTVWGQPTPGTTCPTVPTRRNCFGRQAARVQQRRWRTHGAPSATHSGPLADDPPRPPETDDEGWRAGGFGMEIDGSRIPTRDRCQTPPQAWCWALRMDPDAARETEGLWVFSVLTTGRKSSWLRRYAWWLSSRTHHDLPGSRPILTTPTAAKPAMPMTSLYRLHTPVVLPCSVPSPARQTLFEIRVRFDWWELRSCLLASNSMAHRRATFATASRIEV